jgi:hypothetical protein
MLMKRGFILWQENLKYKVSRKVFAPKKDEVSQKVVIVHFKEPC